MASGYGVMAFMAEAAVILRDLIIWKNLLMILPNQRSFFNEIPSKVWNIYRKYDRL